MPQPTVKLFATLTSANHHKIGSDREVTDEAEAARIALQDKAIYFKTYEMDVTERDGRLLKGFRTELSPRRYVGIEPSMLMTRDDVIRKLYDDMVQEVVTAEDTHPLARQFNSSIARAAAIYQAEPAENVYIYGFMGGTSYTPLAAGEKVFDKQGRQIFPHPQNIPAPSDKNIYKMP